MVGGTIICSIIVCAENIRPSKKGESKVEWYFIVLIVAGAVLLILGLGVRYALKRAFLPKRMSGEDYYRGLEEGGRCYDPERCRTLIDRMLKLPLERVSIKSHDGLTLVGYYYEVKAGAPVEIFFHGFRGGWQRDFCGITEAAVELSHNILFVDQRSHGESEGRVITYGINERRDAILWVNYIIERFGEGVEIVLVGASMGGATVLSAAGEKLPKNVKAIISDSGFTTPLDVMAFVCGGGRLGDVLVRFGARAVARIFCGFNINETSAVRAVSGAEIPIMLMHGRSDRIVPHDMAEELVRANPNIRLESFDGADHIQSYLVDSDRSRAAYKDFLKKSGVKI